MVTGDVSFHGKTRTFEHGMQIDVHDDGVALTGEDVFDIREFGMKPPSMLMVRVYPEISVRVELHGVHATRKHAERPRGACARVCADGVAAVGIAVCRHWLAAIRRHRPAARIAGVA